MTRLLYRVFVAVVTANLLAGVAHAQFDIIPARLVLEGNLARAQLRIKERAADGSINEHAADLTQRALYHSDSTAVATVTPSGEVRAIGNGRATIGVRVGAVSQAVVVEVRGVAPAAVIDFNEQIMPILAKAGCSAGACHASQYGQGGFKLSVFGFAPHQDHYAITRDGISRRVNFVEPTRSLLLLKPTGGVPHAGGRRLEVGSVDYQVLTAWLAGGAPGPRPKARQVTGLEVQPARRAGTGAFTQQLRVVATYDDGGQRDVTAWAKYDSTDDGVLRVTPKGLVEVIGRGQGTALIRFEGRAAIMQVVVPFESTADMTGWMDNNFIDHLAAAKFRRLGLTPAPLCDDAVFLRRAFLDVLGTLPAIEQTTAFLDSKDADKRRKLIERVLGLTGDPAQDVYSNEYAAWWALRWADLLRSTSLQLGDQGMWSLHNWLQGSFRENRSFDWIMRELVTAKGSTYSNGPANFFQAFGSPDARTEAVAQIFLGVRLQCAKCHHHPFETISQADYYGLAAYFARVGTKASHDRGVRMGVTEVVVLGKGDVQHPRTGQLMLPTPLHAKPGAERVDRRLALADWIARPDNPYFARNIVNRYWAQLMGRGLIEPIDDLRATNPATNPELLDALAEDFVKSGFNVKHLLRTIMSSRLYQLDSTPPRRDALDRRYGSHALAKRIAAEPLLDAIDNATGVPTKFTNLPLGTRAIELPDAQYDDHLLKTFGKPKREGVCECERVSDPSLAQALHTLNSEAIIAKIGSPTGRVAKLLAAKKSHDDIVAELYLASVSRRPSDAERAACRKLVDEAPDAKTFYEDLLWSLINSKHFQFVR